MRFQFLAILFCSINCCFAQDPVITSWIINPGNETGYAGIATNVESVHFTSTDVYVSSTCIPGYDIGPWQANPNTPSNQDFVFKITRDPVENTGTPIATPMGHIGVWRNGVSIFNAKDGMSYNNQGIWNRDARVFEGISFDDCLGHPAPNGEYHHHVSPNCLYDHMNDETHSAIIGYAFDGFPIYGAYGFFGIDGSGGIIRMQSSYRLRDIGDRTSLPDGTLLSAAQFGPAIGGQYPLGAFLEDYEYVPDHGDLDEHNGRFCVTPEYPDGIYAYFVTLDDALEPAYPYVIGPSYYGIVQPGNTGPQSGHNTIPAEADLYEPATDVTENEIADDISIYPIPCADRIFISAGSEDMITIEIRDMLGKIQLITKRSADVTAIDVDRLSSGHYFARLIASDGRSRPLSFVKE